MNMNQKGNTHNLIYTNMQIHPKLLPHGTTCFPTLLLSVTTICTTIINHGQEEGNQQLN